MQKRKVQIVIMAQKSGIHRFLIFKTNASRGEFWQNVTGSAEEQESFEQAALRELKEETGIEQVPLSLIDNDFHFIDNWGAQCLERCFVAKVDAQYTPQISDEHIDYCWIDISQVDKLKYKTNQDAITLCL